MEIFITVSNGNGFIFPATNLETNEGKATKSGKQLTVASLFKSFVILINDAQLNPFTATTYKTWNNKAAIDEGASGQETS